MRCKRCGQEMKVKSVEVGKDTQGNPIYNDYAFCYECKIKINLDKRKAKVGKPGESKDQEPEKEDLSLTRVFEAQVEPIVAKDREEVDSTKYTREQKKSPDRNQEKKTGRDSEKRPSRKRTEQPKKRPEKKPDSIPEKRVKGQPERRPEKPRKESRIQRETDFDSIPEKRVKEVRKREKPRRKKGKGIIKFIVFILIVAAIGAAVYFNRDTVKGWIHIGLEKFDSMSDNKEDKKDDANSDATKEGNTDSNDVTDAIDGVDETDGTDGTDSSAEGTSDTASSTQTQGTTNTEDNTTTTE